MKSLFSRTVVSALALVALLGLVAPALADEGLPLPKKEDRCPVCGMFVAKFKTWVATVRLEGGALHHFDGPRDLFRYLFDVPRWAPGHTRKEVTEITVTEYYATKRIDAKKALYVIGSDVEGPMGPELVPLATRADAEAFLKDHRGARILTFDEVTPEVLEHLTTPPREK